MQRIWVIGILIAAFSLCVGARGQAPKRFVQDRFAIGYWVGPQTSENLRERYREIAEANFTLVIGSHGMDITKQLALCQEFGLKAIVDAAGLALPDDEACWGFALRDEPSASQFPDLARRAEEVRASHPGKFGYINLFPNYVARAIGNRHLRGACRKIRARGQTGSLVDGSLSVNAARRRWSWRLPGKPRDHAEAFA